VEEGQERRGLVVIDGEKFAWQRKAKEAAFLFFAFARFLNIDFTTARLATCSRYESNESRRYRFGR